ncbi:MAG TPA: helix-turn-helix transcriptional regulator [Acidimicrobiia bacterium]|nr:helix-turn-helix transcriptional regulator [Acidimicrobiia bacterium]
MNDAMAIGRAIREARLEKGMSLGQLAAAVGRSSSSVRRWERGEVPPAIGIIDDLAKVLELDPDELRSLRPDPDPVAERDEPDTPSPATPIDVIPRIESTGLAFEPEPQPDSGGSGRRPPGFIGDVVEVVRGATAGWTGWIRGLLTFAVLLVMAIILVWALGELFGALGEIWNSFDAETAT